MTTRDDLDELKAKAAKWDRIKAMWDDLGSDWDNDSRDLMRELTKDDG